MRKRRNFLDLPQRRAARGTFRPFSRRTLRVPCVTATLAHSSNSRIMLNVQPIHSHATSAAHGSAGIFNFRRRSLTSARSSTPSPARHFAAAYVIRMRPLRPAHGEHSVERPCQTSSSTRSAGVSSSGRRRAASARLAGARPSARARSRSIVRKSAEWAASVGDATSTRSGSSMNTGEVGAAPAVDGPEDGGGRGACA